MGGGRKAEMFVRKNRLDKSVEDRRGKKKKRRLLRIGGPATGKEKRFSKRARKSQIQGGKINQLCDQRGETVRPSRRTKEEGSRSSCQQKHEGARLEKKNNRAERRGGKKKEGWPSKT